MKRVALFLSVLLLLLAIPVTVFAARPLVPVPEDTSPIDELMAGPAEFALSQLEAAQDKILDIFSRNKIAAMVALNSKANTIEIYAPEEQVKPLKPQILKAAGASLSRKLIFVYKDSPVPAETAQTPGNSVSELYILDAKNQAYIKADTNAANMINGLTENAVLLKKALPVREGTALVFLEDGTRLSYFFEENGDLNVNGACYRVQPAAREAFEKKLAELKASPGASKHPKWLAWMQAENITTISSGKAQDYRDIRIESGKRLALADVKPPENARKAEISFKSGVKYTLTFAENTLNIISSDLDYACAYTLSPQTRTQ